MGCPHTLHNASDLLELCGHDLDSYFKTHFDGPKHFPHPTEKHRFCHNPFGVGVHEEYKMATEYGRKSARETPTEWLMRRATLRKLKDLDVPDHEKMRIADLIMRDGSHISHQERADLVVPLIRAPITHARAQYNAWNLPCRDALQELLDELDES